MEEKRGGEDRFYDVHGAVAIRLVGHDSVSDSIDRTLAFFRSSPKDPDLTLVLGQLPSADWRPTGTFVGDRILYDPESGTTTVLMNRAIGTPEKSDVEYVVVGDLRTLGVPVTVYVPKVWKPMTPRKSFGQNLKGGHFRRAVLALAGNPFGMQRVVKQAERITEAILEPFLFFRLPAKGLTLVHAASISSQDKATMLAGSANIGKSTIALHFVREKMSFLGDTFVILCHDGEVLPYPGLVKLHAGHLVSFPELTNHFTSGMGSIGGRLLRGELSTNPEAIALLPQPEMVELFEGVIVPARCKLENIFLVKRGSFNKTSCEKTDSESVARALSAELYWEVEAAPWRKDQFTYSPSPGTGRDFFQDANEHHIRVNEIMRKGISHTSCYDVALPVGVPARSVEEMVSGILGTKKT
jgi:hypothetical protein